MSGYDLSRAWFDFSFENPEKISPIHSALYFFAIEHCNRLGWKENFGLPTTMVMEAVGIKSYSTYKKALNCLVEWGFIKMVSKSKNQYSSNIVALVKNTKATTKALDKALSKHSTKHSTKHCEYNKTKNKEQVNTISDAKKSFDKFRKLYPGIKRALSTEFENFIKKHSDWADVAPTLNSTLEKLIQSRQKKKERGEFIPEWKHLQTWINQRCWEEESGEDEGNAPVLKFNSTSNLGFYFSDANTDTLYVVRKKEVAIGFIDTEKYFPDLPDDTLMIAFKSKKGGLFTKYLGVAPLDESGQVIKELKKIRECLKRVS